MWFGFGLTLVWLWTGEWEFEPNEVTDLDPEERALEVSVAPTDLDCPDCTVVTHALLPYQAVKQAIFQCCHQELPYVACKTNCVS